MKRSIIGMQDVDSNKSVNLLLQTVNVSTTCTTARAQRSHSKGSLCGRLGLPNCRPPLTSIQPTSNRIFYRPLCTCCFQTTVTPHCRMLIRKFAEYHTQPVAWTIREPLGCTTLELPTIIFEAIKPLFRASTVQCSTREPSSSSYPCSFSPTICTSSNVITRQRCGCHSAHSRSIENQEDTNRSPRLLADIAFRSYATPMIFCN
jgi:hypothetical protein